jgi:hypothetical protein
VGLPYALGRKYPNLAKSWLWQYVFSANKHVWHEETRTWRRHRIVEDTLQRAVSAAGRAAGIEKAVSCRVLSVLKAPGFDVTSPLDRA